MQMWQKAFGGMVTAKIENQEWKVLLTNLNKITLSKWLVQVGSQIIMTQVTFFN